MQDYNRPIDYANHELPRSLPCFRDSCGALKLFLMLLGFVPMRSGSLSVGQFLKEQLAAIDRRTGPHLR